MNLALPININKEISCSQLLGLINPRLKIFWKTHYYTILLVEQ